MDGGLFRQPVAEEYYQLKLNPMMTELRTRRRIAQPRTVDLARDAMDEL